MLEMPKPGISPRRAEYRERIYLAALKLEGKSQLNPLIPDMQPWDLMFDLLDSSCFGPPSWSDSAYSVPLYVKMCNLLFCFSEGYN